MQITVKLAGLTPDQAHAAAVVAAALPGSSATKTTATFVGDKANLVPTIKFLQARAKHDAGTGRLPQWASLVRKTQAAVDADETPEAPARSAVAAKTRRTSKKAAANAAKVEQLNAEADAAEKTIAAARPAVPVSSSQPLLDAANASRKAISAKVSPEMKAARRKLTADEMLAHVGDLLVANPGSSHRAVQEYLYWTENISTAGLREAYEKLAGPITPAGPRPRGGGGRTPSAPSFVDPATAPFGIGGADEHEINRTTKAAWDAEAAKVGGNKRDVPADVAIAIQDAAKKAFEAITVRRSSRKAA